jgi:hypothetical protein
VPRDEFWAVAEPALSDEPVRSTEQAAGLRGGGAVRISEAGASLASRTMLLHAPLETVDLELLDVLFSGM